MDFSNEYFSNLNQQKRYSADEETLDNMVKRQRLQQQQYGQLPSTTTPSQVSPSQVDSDPLLGQSDAFSSFNFQPYTPNSQQNFSFPFRGPSMLPPPMHNLMQQSQQPQMESLNQQSLNQQSLSQQQQQQQHNQQQQQQLNYMFFQQQPPFFSTQRTNYPSLGQFNSALGMGNSTTTTIAPITAPVLTMETPLPEEPTPNYQSIYKYNPPQAMPAVVAKKKRGSDPMKKKEGLEESSVRIIGLLQTRGKMIFKDIHETLNIDYRRAYDILNILLTTTLITKVGKKRENKLPFIYQDGTPLPEPVEIRDIINDIQREEELNATLKQRIALLEEELNKEDPNFKGLKDRDPLLQSDPLYKDLV